MYRCHFLCLRGSLLACVFLASVSLEAATRRPNIVLIVADDLGVRDLHCYGRDEHETPHLDRLAAQGMRFTCAYTAQPICSPSRAALLTGKHPARLHLTNYLPGRADASSQLLLQPRIEGQLPREETTLAELLRDAGYATGLFGKWHLGHGAFGPAEQGFGTVFEPPANTQPSATEGGKGEMAIAQAANAFIEAHRDQPFFCYVAHNAPHIPLQARGDRVAHFAHTFHPTYAAVVETLDTSVGSILATLDRHQLTDDTIVIFTSDNGGLHVLESPGTPATHQSPFRAGKGYLYEGGLRVPLIVRWPPMIPGHGLSDTPVSLLDIPVSLLALAGIDGAQTVGPLDGLPLTTDWPPAPQPDRIFAWHFPHYTNQGSRPASAIRRGDWKLIEHLEDGSLELFNVVDDEGESHNLVDTEPAQVQSLQAALHQWRDQLGAQMPTRHVTFSEQLHRQLYVDRDPSRIVFDSISRGELERDWQPWRSLMNEAVRGRTPRVTPAAGDIRLDARTAQVHGETLRYEPQPHKNVLGYWIRMQDWAEWNFTVATSGTYEVEVQQGCGAGSGGADIELMVAQTPLRFTVVDTGHFQQMVRRTIGEVKLAAGPTQLTVKPQTKPGVAVMDLRQVVLRPVASP